MTYIAAIVVIVFVVCLIFAYIGSIKYQVKFYTKRYSQGLNSGYTNEESIHRLVAFYLRKEPEWKAEYMNSRLVEYYKSYDQLVYDIALFYYKIDPEQQTWRVDRLSRPVPSERIFHYIDKYLRIYKRRYFDLSLKK